MNVASQSLGSSKLNHIKVDNHSIDIACTEYENKFFIVITEFGKIGNLVLVSQETNNDKKFTVFSTTSLLGKDEPEIHAAARFIVEQLGITKTVIIGIALKDYSHVVIRNVVNHIKTLR